MMETIKYLANLTNDEEAYIFCGTFYLGYASLNS